jgi:hypothetical protein
VRKAEQLNSYSTSVSPNCTPSSKTDETSMGVWGEIPEKALLLPIEVRFQTQETLVWGLAEDVEQLSGALRNG